MRGKKPTAKQVLRDRLDLNRAGAIGLKYNGNYRKLPANVRKALETEIDSAKKLIESKRSATAQMQACLASLKQAMVNIEAEIGKVLKAF